MSKHFRLATIIGRTYDNDPDDTLKTKTALKRLGYYETPKYGMTPYTDESLFRGIEEFQGDFDLKTDGVIKPDRQTATRMDEVLAHKEVLARAGASRRHESDPGKRDSTGEQVAVAPAIASIVIRYAARHGLPLMAAYMKWLSLSPEERRKAKGLILQSEEAGGGEETEEEREEQLKRCDELHEIDKETCRAISRSRGAQAAQRCWATANNRVARCREGWPPDDLPPLDTWNN